jgi:hypothetical protein
VLWLFKKWRSWELCHGWPRNAILLISTFQVVRITCVNHCCPAVSTFIKKVFIFYNKLTFHLGHNFTFKMEWNKKLNSEKIPRWRLEGGSRKRAS